MALIKFEKGSKEAKEYMAKIRALKGKKEKISKIKPEKIIKEKKKEKISEEKVDKKQNLKDMKVKKLLQDLNTLFEDK